MKYIIKLYTLFKSNTYTQLYMDIVAVRGGGGGDNTNCLFKTFITEQSVQPMG